jgi:gas vesicle protein
MRSGKVVLGVITGVAVGAALGILFAPDKGSTTRRKISRRSDDYVEGLGDRFHELIGIVTTNIESLSEEVVHLAEKGKSKVRAVETKIKESANSNS